MKAGVTPELIEKIGRLMGGIPYIFHRKDGWYPLQLESDFEARENAECNPGTLKVVNGLTEEVVWEA